MGNKSSCPRITWSFPRITSPPNLLRCVTRTNEVSEDDDQFWEGYQRVKAVRRGQYINFDLSLQDAGSMCNLLNDSCLSTISVCSSDLIHLMSETTPNLYESMDCIKGNITVDKLSEMTSTIYVTMDSIKGILQNDKSLPNNNCFDLVNGSFLSTVATCSSHCRDPVRQLSFTASTVSAQSISSDSLSDQMTASVRTSLLSQQDSLLSGQQDSLLSDSLSNYLLLDQSLKKQTEEYDYSVEWSDVNENCTVSVATDDSNPMISMATDDSNHMISVATDDSNHMISVATDDSNHMISMTTDDSNHMISVATDDSNHMISMATDDSNHMISVTGDDNSNELAELLHELTLQQLESDLDEERFYREAKHHAQDLDQHETSLEHQEHASQYEYDPAVDDLQLYALIQKNKHIMCDMEGEKTKSINDDKSSDCKGDGDNDLVESADSYTYNPARDDPELFEVLKDATINLYHQLECKKERARMQVDEGLFFSIVASWEL